MLSANNNSHPTMQHEERNYSDLSQIHVLTTGGTLMHHKRRYQNHFTLRILFYGESITEQEKQTAQRLIQANAINLDCCVESVAFVRDVSQIKGVSL